MTQSPIPPGIRELLACPRCHGPLRDADTPHGGVLACDSCRLAYPVVDGIPILLIERAESITV